MEAQRLEHVGLDKLREGLSGRLLESETRADEPEVGIGEAPAVTRRGACLDRGLERDSGPRAPVQRRPVREAGGVAEEIAQGGSRLQPVEVDRRIKVDDPALGQAQRHGRREHLRNAGDGETGRAIQELLVPVRHPTAGHDDVPVGSDDGNRCTVDLKLDNRLVERRLQRPVAVIAATTGHPAGNEHADQHHTKRADHAHPRTVIEPPSFHRTCTRRGHQSIQSLSTACGETPGCSTPMSSTSEPVMPRAGRERSDEAR